ncbi:major tail protein [Streptomyces phage BillNye]|uniref:Major tail protein n=2 Tax=Wilnyevirus billnye TaxID=2560486 RepID=A0A2L1IVL3_9CAUD|nr:tail protein [Streptomyces phage BillNye]AVD99240.1 major tail protein [Streptomyces phage BillNye]QBZ72324.1 major tail protein [Streptomyces phage Circinus]
MKGTYRFYQQGELIATHENLITTEGERLILRYLAGNAASLGDAIGLGVMATPATVADARLGFEVYRASVSVRSIDYDAGTVLFKGAIDQNSVFALYEAGLWSTETNALGATDSVSLTTFDTIAEEWTNVTVDATQARTSEDSVRVDAAASSTTSPRLAVAMDLTGYSTEDVFSLAFYKPDNNIASITLYFGNSLTGGTLKLTKTVSSMAVGYNVVQFRKGDFVATGTITWDTIDTLGFDVTAGATGGYVILDGLRVEDTDTPDQDHVLVSRTVMSTPLIKSNTAPMDVEYTLEFNVT